jgi:SNF2 family DNA or RNA helicase
MSTDLDKRMELFQMYLRRSGMEFKQYQYDGVLWCLRNETRSDPPCKIRGGFIADEMGLGKTILMIGTFVANFLQRTLIVLPPVLIDQWVSQIYRTTGHKPLVYHGDNKKKITADHLNSAHIVIATYAAISINKKKSNKGKRESEGKEEVGCLLHTIKWSRIVFDEAHHLRNKNTGMFAGAKLLDSRIRWLVSGTPIQNRKNDLYNLLSALKMPASFYNDENNYPTIISDFILKRTKKQVGINMIDVSMNNELVEWKSKKEMALSKEIHNALPFTKVMMSELGAVTSAINESFMLTNILRARQSCVLPNLIKNSEIRKTCKEGIKYSSKIDSVVDLILDRKDNGNGKLIFCNFKLEMDEISRRLVSGGVAKVAMFDGRTSYSSRHKILSEKNDVLILQIQTGCEGLNLQENYSEIYFVSPHWNPAVEEQAIARCHRIGQQKEVNVFRFEMAQFDDDIKNVDEDGIQIASLNMDKYISDIQAAKKTIANDCINFKISKKDKKDKKDKKNKEIEIEI